MVSSWLILATFTIFLHFGPHLHHAFSTPHHGLFFLPCMELYYDGASTETFHTLTVHGHSATFFVDAHILCFHMHLVFCNVSPFISLLYFTPLLPSMQFQQARSLPFYHWVLLPSLSGSQVSAIVDALASSFTILGALFIHGLLIKLMDFPTHPLVLLFFPWFIYSTWINEHWKWFGRWNQEVKDSLSIIGNDLLHGANLKSYNLTCSVSTHIYSWSHGNTYVVINIPRIIFKSCSFKIYHGLI